MVAISLPDGSVRSYEGPVTGRQIAEDIGPGLAKAALAVTIDGTMKDLSVPITTDASVSLITARDAAALELLRHDAAHVMAQAVQELYPGTQVTIGPAIENGFYYDFARAEPFTPEDLERIEERMREIVGRDLPIVREVWERDEAIAYFTKLGETYKAELITGLPANEDVSVYRQGDWLDLCRGPHLPSTGKLGTAFKLMKLAGAYWRGDSRNPMLQRIYGTAWPDRKQLDAYLTMLAEAEKRDHRRVGQEMDLFHLQEEAQGAVFWHPKGWTVYRTLQNYMRRRLDLAGYVEVNTPMLVDRALWEKSGHWEKFRQNMFISEAEDKLLAMKPMNCPCHIQIFKQGIKSYRDLPLRMAEFGACHRNEASGALHGLMRVRAFVQDDAHIFCTEDQIVSETQAFCDLLKSVYRDLGFTEIKVKFSDRPEVRAGSDETWDKAEAALREATDAAGLEWTLNPGEGAFYGPKLEFVLRDAIGRDWQCGTLQVDFVLPERLGADYVGEDGDKHRPVMLHRAILGTFERFMGILIENCAGRFPFWLAPVQVVVATITSDADDYARTVLAALKAKGLRAVADLRNEKINYKVREHSLAKVPVMLVVGRKEAETGGVALRRLGGQSQEVLALDEAIATLANESVAPDLRAAPQG
ncbi:threonine--tRNA ligase [Rhodospirillum rubrum]|uniref:Threonine--tRNA ligase n=1 Tax=Rhodospirillum rubrum (strain ATCC 11170 / ATH 1.1.1 / DSM 467 / LMG 4362 / NCIMB 8255 / S1) TaxID=269796 RepID=SYT_RHORT|nr:threonine--tRNA ligase [Rhodospirillum rubrum]Q2RNL4.1 RecName: Full=Threonine--tRNA ligase; AltName: Full=Threonyl-tRNA synthetase; Short=ThrRS [Rhodospirillum rubrum ATCC 11170]ABC24281.1 Ser-tRNA(Thr) hydrolase / threonyl-tRNA synthetase [Rhodospirillum rubrum ATCC 11170]AEO50032.1 threonyl-tRNA synthetase [Rhodospirillum rubrum F11]MBK5956000.1 threonine--tRNA ligase [Rhodospirillum rubrum]QXG80209.1 threonine--tRNA ligase [Rhodospirillum rubrum]HAP99052.1 threonine--tRNA ligase [Rhodo